MPSTFHVDWEAVRQEWLAGVSPREIAARHMLASHNHVCVVAKRYGWADGGTGYPGKAKADRILDEHCSRSGYRIRRVSGSFRLFGPSSSASVLPASMVSAPAVPAAGSSVRSPESRILEGHRDLAAMQVVLARRLMEKAGSLLSGRKLTAKDIQILANTVDRASLIADRAIKQERLSHGMDEQSSQVQGVVQIAILVNGQRLDP